MGDNSRQMDRKTINNSTEGGHPYRAFEGSPLWMKINRAVSALVRNGDIKETTRREYIVGYICKTISTRRKTKAKRIRSR
jgi:hypothetical protein